MYVVCTNNRKTQIVSGKVAVFIIAAIDAAKTDYRLS